MKIIEKRYYHIKGTPTGQDVGIGSVRDNHIRAEVYYDEGGYSLFTYKQTPRAYFMSVHKVGYGVDSCGAYESTQIFGNDGAKMLLEEVSRQTKKKEQKWHEYFENNIEDFIKNIYPDLETELV